MCCSSGPAPTTGCSSLSASAKSLPMDASRVRLLVTAVERVGQAITYSALTVAAALLTLLLAPFGIYKGLGPSLALGIVVMLAASLTLTLALLSIFGRAAFWPTRPKPGPAMQPLGVGLWGRVAERVVRRPVVMLVAGVVLFGALATGLIGYRTGGLTSGAPVSSDSAAGAAVLAAHLPKATIGSDQLLLRFGSPVWDNPVVLTQTQEQLASAPVFRSVTGPLGSGYPPGTGSLTAAQIAELHKTLGPPGTLPQAPPAGSPVNPAQYAAYRATAQFISSDGQTVQYYASLDAGQAGSTAAVDAIPQATDALAAVARSVGAGHTASPGRTPPRTT